MWVETCSKAYQVVVIPSSSRYIHSIDQQSDPGVHESLTRNMISIADQLWKSLMSDSNKKIMT